MTQEAIFRLIGTAGLGKGFAAIERLPAEKGDLKGFKVVRLSAMKDEDYSMIERRLVAKFGVVPKRMRVSRSRQIEELFSRQRAKGKLIIIIIGKAHLLASHTLQCLKNLREIAAKGHNPGVVLLGKVDEIRISASEVSSVASRINYL
ncbi:MAG: hypothetical protein OHK006_12770 [Thermodesulfovibrionales bacterium]